MSDFATELKSARSNPVIAESPEAAPEAVAEAPEAMEGLAPADHMADGHDFANGLPVGAKAVTQEVADAAPRQPDVADEIPKIKIAGKEFSTLEDAVRYAEEIEQARKEDQAYIEGVKAAQAKPAVEPVLAKVEPSYIEQAEAILFEDPKKALQLIVEGTEKKIFDAYNKMTNEQREQAEAEAVRQQTWNNFYSENSDLAESKDYVDFILSRNPDLLKKTANEALKELADITRKTLKISKQAALPRTELPSRPAITAGSSMGATGQGAAVTAEPEVDFVTALKQLRKRK